ncbi:MAG: hypothetical protein RXQ00_04500 [Caldivirga sp.]
MPMVGYVEAAARYVARSPYASLIFECIQYRCMDSGGGNVPVNVGELYGCFHGVFPLRGFRSRAEYVIKRFRELGVLETGVGGDVVNCSVVKKVEAEMEEWFKARRVGLDTVKALKVKSLNETVIRLFGINLIEEYLIKMAEVNGFRYYASATLIGHFAGPKAELNRVSGLRLSRGCRRLKSGGSSVECIQRILDERINVGPCGVCGYGDGEVGYTATTKDLVMHMFSEHGKYIIVTYSWLKDNEPEGTYERLIDELSEVLGNVDDAIIATLINHGLASLVDYSMNIVNLITGGASEVGFVVDAVLAKGFAGDNALLLVVTPRRLSSNRNPPLLGNLERLMLDINGHFTGAPATRIMQGKRGQWAWVTPMKYYTLVLIKCTLDQNHNPQCIQTNQ